MILPQSVRKFLGQLTPEQAHQLAVQEQSISILTILDSCPWFHGPNAASWKAWRAFLAALYALPMDNEEQALFRKHTGRTRLPEKRSSEAWLVAGRRSRKALALDTPIPTPSGWTTMGEVKAGDSVYGMDGKPTQVVATTAPMFGHKCYEVEFSDGSKIVADAGHQWYVYDRLDRKHLGRKDKVRRCTIDGCTRKYDQHGMCSAHFSRLKRNGQLGVIYRNNGKPVEMAQIEGQRRHAPRSVGRVLTTEEMAPVVAVQGDECEYAVPMGTPCEGEEKLLPVPPYTLGVWLGDGTTASGGVSSADEEVMQAVGAEGFDVRKLAGKYSWGVRGLFSLLRRDGLLGNKHIPHVYFRASQSQRLELLQGLMDTDGSCTRGGEATFWNKNEGLVSGVEELAASLGLKPTRRVKRAMVDGKDCGLCHSVSFRAKAFSVFRLRRKAARQFNGRTHKWRQIVAIREVPSRPVKCLQVAASDGIYLCGRRFIPTHNSAVAALIGVYEAAFRDHSAYLAPGERAQIPIVAKNMEEANQIRAFAAGILTSHPLLSHLLEKEPTSLEIALTSRCDMKIRAATHMAGRSKNVPCFLGDEIAFYPKRESAHPDEEILAAVRGGMALVPNALTVGLSSPFAKEGVLWERYKEHFGRDGDVLVWQADSREMHDTPVIRAWAVKFISDDPDKAKAEVQGQFRADIAALVPEEVVLACVVQGRDEISPQRGVHYVAFVDPSGGQADSMTLGIAHYDMDKRKTVLDYLGEWRVPFKFTDVVAGIAAILGQYRVTSVWGDKYGGNIPAQAFRDVGIAYYTSDLVRSDIYKAGLPLLNSLGVELLDNKRLIAQLCGLKRRLHEGGRDSVDHPRDGADDVCNSGIGSIIYAERLRRPIDETIPEYTSTEEIVHARMWAQAKKQNEPQWQNPYAVKGR